MSKPTLPDFTALWRDRHPNSCEVCKGWGYTKATAPEIAVIDGTPKTIERGSGCPRCLGTGRKDET